MEYSIIIQKNIETGVIKIKYTKFGNSIQLTNLKIKDLISCVNFSSTFQTDIYCNYNKNDKGEFI